MMSPRFFFFLPLNLSKCVFCFVSVPRQSLSFFCEVAASSPFQLSVQWKGVVGGHTYAVWRSFLIRDLGHAPTFDCSLERRYFGLYVLSPGHPKPCRLKVRRWVSKLNQNCDPNNGGATRQISTATLSTPLLSFSIKSCYISTHSQTREFKNCSKLYTLTQFILSVTLGGRYYYYLHFTNEEAEGLES